MFDSSLPAGHPSMEAWVYESQNAPLTRRTVGVPSPAADEVLVRVVAATTNPVDYKRALWPVFPCVAGVDGAGIVERVGDSVTSHKPGDRVHFFNNCFGSAGSFAAYVTVPARAAVPIPSGMSFGVAAVTPCAAWTAYKALYEKLRIQPGKSILISAGAGGVGHLALQMAKRSGLKTITTASGTNVEWVRTAGRADLVLDYRSDDVKAAVMAFTEQQGVDYVFDMLDEATAQYNASLLKYDGQLLHIACAVPPLPNGASFINGHTYHHVMLPGQLVHGPQELDRLSGYGTACDKLLMEGAIVPDISKIIGFQQIGEQMDAQKAGHVRGKVLVSYAKDPQAVLDPDFDGRQLCF